VCVCVCVCVCVFGSHLCELGLDEALTVSTFCRRAGLSAVYLVAVPEHQHLPSVNLQLLAHAWFCACGCMCAYVYVLVKGT